MKKEVNELERAISKLTKMDLNCKMFRESSNTLLLFDESKTKFISIVYIAQRDVILYFAYQFAKKGKKLLDAKVLIDAEEVIESIRSEKKFSFTK